MSIVQLASLHNTEDVGAPLDGSVLELWEAADACQRCIDEANHLLTLGRPLARTPEDETCPANPRGVDWVYE